MSRAYLLLIYLLFFLNDLIINLLIKLTISAIKSLLVAKSIFAANKNTYCTFSPVFADVSIKYEILCFILNASACSRGTSRKFSLSFILPIRIVTTLSSLYYFTSRNQVSKFKNVSIRVIS
jgi:hypothetical protein